MSLVRLVTGQPNRLGVYCLPERITGSYRLAYRMYVSLSIVALSNKIYFLSDLQTNVVKSRVLRCVSLFDGLDGRSTRILVSQLSSRQCCSQPDRT